MSSANEWYMNFLSNRAVDVKRDITSAAASEGYAMFFGRLVLNEMRDSAQYRVQAFFYDSSTSQMFGKPFHTAWVRPNNAQCVFQEEAFFHCPIVDEKVSVVVEIVEDSRNETAVRGVGWLTQNIQNKNQAMLEYRKVPREVPVTTLDVWTGTPKLLTFGVFKPVKCGFIEWQIFSHQNLLRVVDYIPEFCIIGSREEVPGVARGKSDGEPPLASPHMLPLVNASLDDVSIFFGANADKIEKVIVDEISKDRDQKENVPLEAIRQRKVAVIDRRLKIGVHNGFCYLSEPLSLSLSCSTQNLFSSNSLLRKRRALSSNDLKSETSTLFVNSRVSLPKLSEDARLVVVFALEYLFTVDNDAHCSQPILIAWGAWKPTSQGQLPSHVQATVSLVGGPRPNPEATVCFKNLLHLFRRDDSVFTESVPKISIHFSFFVDQLRLESRLSTHRDVVSEEPRRERLRWSDVDVDRDHADKSANVGTFGRRSDEPRRRRVDDDDGEKSDTSTPVVLPRIDSNANVFSTSDDELKAIEMIIEKDVEIQSEQQRRKSPRTIIYSIPFDESRVSNFPRSTHALVSREKFAPIKDRNDASPELVDVTSKTIIDMNVERNDRLECNEILFQFIAYKNSKTNGNSPTSKVFFAMQFYRFPQLTTEVMLLANANEKGNADVGILKRLDKNGKILDDTSGFLAKFIVERESDDDKDDVIAFLALCHVVIDVWNAESSIYVGSAIVPLKSLLRGGKEAVQAFVACPVVNASRPSSVAQTGILFLRIANVGHPSSLQIDAIRSRTTATTSKRLLKWSDEGPHSYRVLAKPLNVVHSSSLQRFLAAQRLDLQQRYDEVFNEEANERIRQWQNLQRQNLPIAQKPHEKFLFEEELEAYKKLRYESKATRLLEAVFKGITVRYEIRPSFGEKTFFEFPLENTFVEPINCIVEIDDPNLSVLMDLDEWAFNKKAKKLQTPLEKAMTRSIDGHFEIFLKPRETLFVPFVYDAFGISNEHDLHTTKVIFRRWDSQEPLTILDLHVRNRAYCTQHSFVFVDEAATNCEKALLVSAVPGGRRVAAVRCTDAAVKIQLRNVALQQIVHFSAYCGQSGENRSFLVFLYSDQFESGLLATWKVTVFAMTRVDLRGVVGQTSKIGVSLQSFVWI